MKKRPERGLMVRFGHKWPAAAIVAAGYLIAAVSAGSEPQVPQATDVFDRWTLRCETPGSSSTKICEVSSSVLIRDEQGNEAVAAVLAFARDAEGEDWRTVIQAPISVWLSDGVMVVDGEDEEIARATYSHCRPTFCRATLLMMPSEVAKLADSEVLYLIYRLQNGQRVRVEVSTNGLSEALAATL